MRFDNKVVLVTGVAVGIGKVTALAFLNEGADVVGMDLLDRAQLGGELQRAAKFTYHQASVLDRQQVRDVFTDIEKQFQRVNIVVNNVGGFKEIKYCEEVSEEEWDYLIDLNLKSCFLTCKFALPLMKKQRSGRIINMSSIAGRQPVGRSSVAYATGKAGVVGFTKYLALELAPWGITVNAVSPITTLTPRVARTRSEADRARIAQRIPLGRLAEPEDSAAAILFLASDEARFISGITLDVTGGTYMG